MKILLTGIAGFIGYHTAKRLLEAGYHVVGVDNINDYYPPALKRARLAALPPCTVIEGDLALPETIQTIQKHAEQVDVVIHLAAQAGVRYSLENPFAYSASNLEASLRVLEYCRHMPKQPHLVYASSSSVYGSNRKLPFSIHDPVENPVSLYAATKRSMELLSACYSRLYGIPATGLRFFTVYGPWGRPDMAVWKFTEAILNNQPIDVYNHGDMKRDFTYIDDIVGGITAVMQRPPSPNSEGVPHALYNLGNHKSEALPDFIATLEKALGKKAMLRFLPMQAGDVQNTYADITESTRDFGFLPQTTIAEGLPKFVEWFRAYNASYSD